jgi:Zn-dependent protease
VFATLTLGRCCGFPIRASALFVPLLAVVAVFASAGGGGAAMLAQIAVLLASVFVHELAHALVARRLGIRVLDIVLGPLICSARMAEIPERPRIEAAVAAAGPLSNLALAALAAPFLWLGGGAANPLLQWFVDVNLVLGVFNLLPGFPMDGGRLLRSALATRLGWLGATEAAVQVGRGVALTMALLGVFVFRGAFWLMPLIAVYIWFAGTRERWLVRARHGRSPLSGEPLGDQGLAGFPGLFGNFGPGGATWAPAAGSGAPAEPEPSAPRRRSSRAADPSGARRPVTVDVEELSQRSRGGFDDELVRELESYRGRLRG